MACGDTTLVEAVGVRYSSKGGHPSDVDPSLQAPPAHPSDAAGPGTTGQELSQLGGRCHEFASTLKTWSNVKYFSLCEMLSS